MKRTFSHWLPKYIIDRTTNIFYELLNPNNPWLNRHSINIIKKLIKTEDIGIEFGSGRSTFWLGQRCKKLTSFENNKKWFTKVKNQIDQNSLNNIFLKLLIDEKNCIDEIDSIDDCSIDFCLVDGPYRDTCTLEIIPKLKKNAFLIIDNVNRYIPNKSLTKGSIRSFDEKTKWKKVHEALKNSRCIWTSDGVSDTAIFFI